MLIPSAVTDTPEMSSILRKFLGPNGQSKSKESCLADSEGSIKQLLHMADDAAVAKSVIASNSMVCGGLVLEEVVSLPELVDVNEWVFSQIYDLFHMLNALVEVAAVQGTCVPGKCNSFVSLQSNQQDPSSSSSNSSMLVVWLSWNEAACKDSCVLAGFCQPDNCDPATFVNCAMEWMERRLSEEGGVVQDDQQQQQQRNSSVAMLLVLVSIHLYHRHWEELQLEGLGASLNTIFKHLILVCRKFALVDLEQFYFAQHLIASVDSHCK